jgi:redox-sensitive bicupin YhaK (pirin superfamily)
MSAGTGVMHSERNPSATNGVHFLQIWIRPSRTGVAPSYEQKRFEADEKRGRLRLVVSPDGADGSVRIQQDAHVHAGLFDADESATHSIAPGRRAYVHVACGSVRVNGTALKAGDAAKVESVREIVLDGGRDAEVLLFDLPGEAA